MFFSNIVVNALFSCKMAPSRITFSKCAIHWTTDNLFPGLREDPYPLKPFFLKLLCKEHCLCRKILKLDAFAGANFDSHQDCNTGLMLQNTWDKIEYCLLPTEQSNKWSSNWNHLRYEEKISSSNFFWNNLIIFIYIERNNTIGLNKTEIQFILYMYV